MKRRIEKRLTDRARALRREATPQERAIWGLLSRYRPKFTRQLSIPPYTADLAFVGRSLGKYQVYVGGNLQGSRLAELYADLVPLDGIAALVRPLFERFRDERLPGERFGDFWARTGLVPLDSVNPGGGFRPHAVATHAAVIPVHTPAPEAVS